MVTFVNLAPGDTAPWFVARSSTNPRYAFDTVAGRYVVLCFFASSTDAHSRAALAAMRERADVFDDTTAAFFGISLDPCDEIEHRLADRYPGYRYLFDPDGTASRLYGAVATDADFARSEVRVRRLWVVLDPQLRVLRVVPFAADCRDIAEINATLDALPPVPGSGVEAWAPVLLLPNVFEPDFCRRLVDLFESDGGSDSGFMRDSTEKTVGVLDHSFKRRRDCAIGDPQIVKDTQVCIRRRIAPQVLRAYQFEATRMERYLIACYAAEDNGHFRPHRDNTTRATAHRRFAVSINLNDDYEGGEIGFPEYGPRTYRPPLGGALVFSCSLLHSVEPMTRGKRYAFLPFLYDEAAARIRAENHGFLEKRDAKRDAPERKPKAPAKAKA
ncbi:MAG TPA: 2OG-Fe(II) oxygenase [Alphaproteobacteria bacterium]|jgi:peroxiredoxin|nr:2OG-Fe(II) oxygenase [Alphaproteobacteria bacterium]